MINLSFYLKELKVYARYKLKSPIPCVVGIRVTVRCNLRCYFCRSWKIRSKNEMPTKQIFLLIDDLEKIGVPSVTITGGEPLLRRDIGKIGLYLRKKRITSTLSTNGILITENRAKELSKAYDIIRIAIDGFNKTHDASRGTKEAYQKAIAGLNRLISSRDRTARVGIQFSLTDYNSHEAEKIIENFKGAIDFINILPICDYSQRRVEISQRTIPLWEKLQKRLKEYGLGGEIDEFLYSPSFETGKKYCEAGKLYFFINPDGTVRPCPSKKYSIGNVNNESFYGIWKRGLDEKTKRQIIDCTGCYLMCTTGASMLFRKSPIELLRSSIRILKAYKHYNKT